METQRAILAHYREAYPGAQTRDDLLIFVEEGVVVLFSEDCAVLLSECHNSPAFTRLLAAGFANQSETALDRVYQHRAWKYLTKLSRCRHLEYCDPKLFDIIDETLKQGKEYVGASCQ